MRVLINRNHAQVFQDENDIPEYRVLESFAVYS
jgi:hypothetical protein